MKEILTFSPLVFFLFFAYSCGELNNESENDMSRGREVVVETTLVELRSFPEIIRVTGTVEAFEDAMISSEVPGRVLSVMDRGTNVSKGEALMMLDDRVVRSSLEMARANYELAEDGLQRQEPLLRDSIISTFEYNQAKALRDQARAQLEQAEKAVGDSRVEAPFSGRIEERLVNTGELVNPGFPVLRLVNTDRVRIHAGVPERYINDIDKGTPAEIHLKSYNGEKIEAAIQYAGNMISSDTRTFPVEITLSNPNNLLKPEMVVNLAITRKVYENVLIVPRTALVRDEDGLLLYVVREENDQKWAEARRVTTGPSSGLLIVIEEGIHPGEKVIVTGQNQVSDGDRIRNQGRRNYDL